MTAFHLSVKILIDVKTADIEPQYKKEHHISYKLPWTIVGMTIQCSVCVCVCMDPINEQKTSGPPERQIQGYVCVADCLKVPDFCTLLLRTALLHVLGEQMYPRV